MKTKEIKELNTKTSAELSKLVTQTRLEVVKLNLNYKSGKERNLGAMITKRRDLARLLTKLHEKELHEQTA